MSAPARSLGCMTERDRDGEIEGLAGLLFLTWNGVLLGDGGASLLEQARASARETRDPGERELFVALVEELIATRRCA